MAAGLAVLLLSGLAYVALARWRARPLPPFPPATSSAASASTAPSLADYAGAAACVACHAAEHGDWAESTHGNAGGPPERRPLRPFAGTAIRFADAVVVPEESPLRFTVRRPGREPETYRVAGVVGGAHLAGGGTQAYFTRFPDGTVRMLPWELTGDGVWFCNTSVRVGQGWQPIGTGMRLGDCGDWPPRRVLGQHDQLGTCQECHGSQIASVPSGAAGQTRWQSLAIDCEACHGPARRHVEAAGATEAVPASLAALDKQESVRLCLRCHALKDALQPGYHAGRDLDAHYSVGLPLVAEDGVFPDGRTRSFAYQEGHLFSACYLNGGMTCVDCHEPHGQTYRSFQRAPLPGRLDDGQCTSCHPSKALEPQRHTRHTPASPGSRCVSCHMPYLQQPDVGTQVRYTRSDHTISIPRPALDAQFGIRGACAGCHADRSATELAATVEQWYGPVKPLPRVAAALAGGRQPAGLQLLLEDTTSHPAILALLGRELRRAGADATYRLGRSDRSALARLARHPDPDFAAPAMALLHLAAGDEHGVRRVLVEALASHAESQRVRSRWVALLGWVGDIAVEQQRDERALAAYRKALELRPSDAAVLRSLGYAHLRRGEATLALQLFQRAVAAHPADALTHVAVGIARATMGDDLAAAAAYAAALRANAFEPLAHFNLGNVALRAGRVDEAIARYERAVELDPGMAAAHFNLARARMARGELRQAALALRAGLEFDRGNAAAAQLLAELEATGSGH